MFQNYNGNSMSSDRPNFFFILQFHSLNSSTVSCDITVLWSPLIPFLIKFRSGAEVPKPRFSMYAFIFTALFACISEKLKWSTSRATCSSVIGLLRNLAVFLTTDGKSLNTREIKNIRLICPSARNLSNKYVKVISYD